MSRYQSTVNSLHDLNRGTSRISGKEDCLKLLKEYPDNPFVTRMLADFLKKEKSFVQAIAKYREAYRLFMADGETLRAITTLFELWDIVTPTTNDLRTLHSNLRRKKSHISAISECFAAMSYKELKGTISCLEKTVLKTDEVIISPGEPEDTLFFVVSGELVKSKTDDDGDKPGGVSFLKSNDHFGDDHSLDSREKTEYKVTAAGNVELLTIRKNDFHTLCQECPGLKEGIKKLLKYQQLPEDEKPEKFLRKTSRNHLTIPLTFDIFDRQPGITPLAAKGYSTDISLGGACVIVDPKYRDIPIDDIVGRKIRLKVGMPDESIAVSIMGRTTWFRETKINGQETCAVGIEFQDTPPRLRASMIVFVTALGSINQSPADFHLSQDEIEAQNA